jgi:hypothetical protein
MVDPEPIAAHVDAAPIFKGGPEEFCPQSSLHAISGASTSEPDHSRTTTPFRQVFDQYKARSMFFSAFRLEGNSVINPNDSRTIELLSPEWNDETGKFEEEKMGASIQISPLNREVSDKQVGYPDTVSTVVASNHQVSGSSGLPPRSQDKCDFELEEAPRINVVEGPELREQHTKSADVEILQRDFPGMRHNAMLRPSPHNVQHAAGPPRPESDLNAPLAETKKNITSMDPCLCSEQPIVMDDRKVNSDSPFPSQLMGERMQSSVNDSVLKRSASGDPTGHVNGSQAFSDCASVSEPSRNAPSPAKACCLPAGLCRLFLRSGKADRYGGTKSVPMPAAPLDLTTPDLPLQPLAQPGALVVAVGRYSEADDFQLHHDLGTVWRRTGPIKYPPV